MWDCRVLTSMPEKTTHKAVSSVLRARKTLQHFRLNGIVIQPSRSMINIGTKQKLNGISNDQNKPRTYTHLSVRRIKLKQIESTTPPRHVLQLRYHRIPLTFRCTSATIFPIKLPQFSWKCLTTVPPPTSSILLRKLYYVVSETANLVEKQWGWKLVCASSLQCLADYLQMGSGWGSQPEQRFPLACRACD